MKYSRLWRLFFWINILILAFLFLGLFLDNSVSAYDIFMLIMGILMISGVYSFAYRKKIFNRNVWIVIFWTNLVWDILYIIYEIFPSNKIIKNFSFLSSGVDPSIIILILSLILEIPYVYILFRLSQKKFEYK